MTINLTLWLIITLLIMGVLILANRWLFEPKRLFRKELKLVTFSKEMMPLLTFIFVLRTFLFEPFQIPSGSMIPTLEVGDFIVVNKFAYGIRVPLAGNIIIPVNKPKRGEIMVFIPPGDDRHFIKRVIGLPGDVVEFSNNQVSINGERLELIYSDEYIHQYGRYPRPTTLYTTKIGEREHSIQTLTQNINSVGISGTYRVPQGHYFVVGDNRDGSADSRSCFAVGYCNQRKTSQTPNIQGWSAVPEDHVVGKAVYRWMYWDDFLSLPSFKRNGVLH